MPKERSVNPHLLKIVLNTPLMHAAASTNGNMNSAVTQLFIPLFCIPGRPECWMQHDELQYQPFVSFLAVHTPKYGHLSFFPHSAHFMFFPFLLPHCWSNKRTEAIQLLRVKILHIIKYSCCTVCISIATCLLDVSFIFPT